MTEPLAQVRAAVAGRYEIDREIGRGAFATVYLARDLRHDRSVAFKVLNPDPGSEIGELRFIREIRLLARLQHPNILPLIDSGHVGTTLFYVMPYVAGESLRERIVRLRQLPLDEAIAIGREAADALGYAHAQGVIHRDIKPENILLSVGHPMLADFGIARMLDVAAKGQLTRRGDAHPGTPAYMSPEQLLGDRDVDARSDLYCLGCVVYEMLTGRPPFHGKDGFVKRFTEPPPLASVLRANLPAPIDEVISNAMAREPAERYSTAADFSRALVEASRAESAPARPPRRSIEAPMPAAAPGPPPIAPPPKIEAASARPTRIPVPLTPLLGRDADVRQVLAMLSREGTRLVTLLGPGGIGKTRLAIEVARQCATRFPDGVHFVPLTEATDDDELRGRIAHAIGLRGVGSDSADALIDHLRERRALLVLDNFEQLVQSAPVVSSLLAECPTVKALVTSQVLLRVYGEHEVSVEPLALPAAGQSASAAAAGKAAAVHLFVDRAAAARSGFVLDDANVKDVVAVCAILDGVPLAIELAAARVKTATPPVLLAKLRQALDVLTGGPRDMPPRQRTMRGAIAWSHDLLTDAERRLFRRLAVFAGGATLEAIAAVALDAVPVAEAEEAVAALVDHSLVRQQGDRDGIARFVLLRPIHAFAMEMLDQAGERPELEARHARYYAKLAEESVPHVLRADEAVMDRLEVERANTALAFDRLLECGSVADALGMAVALWRFWDARSYAREGLERLRSALDAPAPDVPIKLRLSALYAAGVLADACGDYATGHDLFERHVTLTSELGDPRATSVSRNNLAIALLRQGEPARAIPHFEAAVEAVRQIGDVRAGAMGTANIGNAYRVMRDFDSARAHYVRALDMFREGGDVVNVAWALSHLGDVSRDEGDLQAARKFYDEAFREFAALGHRRGLASVMMDLGEVALLEGDSRAARASLEEALVHVADAGDQRGMIRVFELLAGASAIEGDARRAVFLAGAVAGLREGLGAPLSEDERGRLERRVAVATEQLGAAESASARREGESAPMEEVLRRLGGGVAL